MRRAWLIAWHGFVQHATSRAFVIGLMLMPLYMVIGGTVPTVSQSTLPGSAIRPVMHFAVADRTGALLPAIDAALERDLTARGVFALNAYALDNADEERLRAQAPQLAKLFLDTDPESELALAAVARLGGVSEAFVALRPYLKPGAPTFDAPEPRYVRVELPAAVAEADDLLAAAKPYLTGETRVRGPRGSAMLWALLVIPEDFLEGASPAEYVDDDVTWRGLRNFLRAALDDELKRRRAGAEGIARDTAEEVLAAAGEVEAVDPDPGRLSLQRALQFTILGPMFVYLMLFMAVFMTANMVVMALVEEKSNRVAELLLSCVTAETLMAGKLATGLMLALFLVAVWLASAVVSIELLYPDAGEVVRNLVTGFVSGTQALQLLTFFALSYLTIGSFYMAAGSAATSITDAQAIVAPATMVTLPVFLLPVAIAYDPESMLARGASYVPVFAPFVMMLRSMGAAEGIDVLGALVVSILTLLWMVRLIARVFRANLLRPDSTSSFLAFLRDLWRLPRSI